MSTFPRLFRQFILRSLAREKLRSALAVFGIALGMAVMVAVRLANISIVESFRAAVDAVSGNADLRVLGTQGDFDEQRLRDLTWLEEYGSVSFLVESYAMHAPGGEAMDEAVAHRPLDRGELLYVLGVDVLRDSNLRRYRLLQWADEPDGRATPRKLLDLLVDDDAIVLTERFARRAGYRLGDSIRLAFGSRVRTLRVSGLLRNDGPARTMQGNFALMDIAAAQWAAGRLGRLDAIDLQLPENADPERARNSIAARLPAELRVEPPSGQAGRTATMVAAFQFNLTALSSVALLVGLFLIYNTISISVSARREEIGVLMAVGATRGTVVLLFLSEAVLLAVIGVAAGLPLGQWLSQSVVQVTSQTVETFYVAAVAETTSRMTPLPALEWLLMGLAGVLLAALAAALPAARAARVDPVEVIRGFDRVPAFRRPRTLLAAAVVLAAAAGCTQLAPVRGLPVFGFVAELLLMLAAAFLVPTILVLACRLGLQLARGCGSLIGRLASANLLAASSQTSVSIAALSMALSMMIAIGVMVGSFRETVVYWLDSVLHADVVVKPVMNSSSLSTATIAPETAEALRQDAAVEAACWYASQQVPYGDSMIRLDTSQLLPLMTYSRILFKSPADAEQQVHSALRHGTPFALVSESFALRYHKKTGDAIELPGPDGPVSLPLLATYYDYSSNLGTVLLDYAVYLRYFKDQQPIRSPLGMSLFLKPGQDPEKTRRRLARTIGAGQSLYFVTNDDVRREALRIFDSTFTITYALQTIAIIIAGAGVVSTLIRLIYERRREIGLLSLVGATAGQLRGMVVTEAVLIGLISQLVGIGLGIVLSWVLVYVINVQSFGWTIQFHLPLAFLVESTLVVLAASALFGLYPAQRAAGIDALGTLREL
jgi:putative ABC transport system permease protein